MKRTAEYLLNISRNILKTERKDGTTLCAPSFLSDDKLLTATTEIAERTAVFATATDEQ